MKKTKESALYIIIRPIITNIFRLLFTPKIINKDIIPDSGRIVIAGNHTHIFDCVLLMCCTKREIHFLAKKELFQGLKKIIFNNLGLIPVDRERKCPEALLQAKDYLFDDKVIGIFPEGTTKKQNNKYLPFKIGAVKMAYDTNSKIIPFQISGKYKLFSRNLKIIFGSPIIIHEKLEKENKKLQRIVLNLNAEVK